MNRRFIPAPSASQPSVQPVNISDPLGQVLPTGTNDRHLPGWRSRVPRINKPARVSRFLDRLWCLRWRRRGTPAGRGAHRLPLAAVGGPRRRGAAPRASVYGVMVAANASVRLLVLPLLVWMKTDLKAA